MRRVEVRAPRGQVTAGPGETADVWRFAVPCRSHGDCGRTTHAGSEPQGSITTFQRPERDGTNQVEVDGNLRVSFTATTCQALRRAGKEFMIESSMLSGQHPELWDPPYFHGLREETRALIVPIYMCAWGKSAPVGPPML